MRLRAVLVGLCLIGSSLMVTPAASGRSDGPDPQPRRPVAPPTLSVTEIVGGLDLPWDVASLPDGRLLVTERDRFQVSLVNPRTQTRRVLAATVPGAWKAGEIGLMGLAVDPAFARNRRFYTCQGSIADGVPDIRVIAWRLVRGHATMRRTLLRGIPAANFHGGCRLLSVGKALFVGTGDAGIGTAPRDLRSLAGKVLRVHARTGRPMRGNPWFRARDRTKRYVWNYGHRNVQGLALRRNGQIFSVEHGPDRDDEVNIVRKGRDYGWNPVPGYDQAVPMTDAALPGKQVPAVWSSGIPTWATSGAGFVYGKRWGSLSGTLAVACLKGQRLTFMRFGKRRLLEVSVPAELTAYGRLRSVRQLRGGDLVVTTSNGGGQDRLLRVHPG